MRAYDLTHLSDAALTHQLSEAVGRERASTAVVVAHIAEFEARRLYAPAGFQSMFDYCVRALHFSEQAALKRIRAARKARRFPVILDLLASGKLHLTGVVLLAPYLTQATAAELFADASHQTAAAIEELLARRFPKPDLPTRIVALGAMSMPTPVGQLSSRTVEAPADELSARTVQPPATELSSRTVGSMGTYPGPEAPASQEAPASHPFSGSAAAPEDQLSSRTVEAPPPAPPTVQTPVEPPFPRPRITPLSAERFAFQFTASRRAYDKLRHLQALLSHAIPTGDLEQVFERALDALTVQLEKRKFAATDKPRPRVRREPADPRTIPAHVKRAVRKRDQDQCTFVSESGLRCSACRFLEYDHVRPVARGGQSTVDNVRLLCRVHNDCEAERAFGAGFMNAKREVARNIAEARSPAAAP